jgi:hypothetical protein
MEQARYCRVEKGLCEQVRGGSVSDRTREYDTGGIVCQPRPRLRMRVCACVGGSWDMDTTACVEHMRRLSTDVSCSITPSPVDDHDPVSPPPSPPPTLGAEPPTVMSATPSVRSCGRPLPAAAVRDSCGFAAASTRDASTPAATATSPTATLARTDDVDVTVDGARAAAY